MLEGYEYFYKALWSIVNGNDYDIDSATFELMNKDKDI